ncbi:glycosyltransferase (plasmid) [Companilactobacillus farciminis]|uniref:glycosyltransferase n=1 Tax=Companilactobacillus TaxID=2767879 RepID=UPI0018A74CAE|nr:glycosyltransferase [Companilactobacillus futsaii]
MIFVTVGTHEQQFNRLLKQIDFLKKNKEINEEVVIQTGFSDYVPSNCTYQQFYDHSVMKKYVKDARIVVTHGGPSSFLMPLQIGKIPIVVPRQKQFDEHVNDHQLDFVEQVKKRQKNIIVVENIADLNDTIQNYDKLVGKLNQGVTSNNTNFNIGMQEIFEDLFK